jgi:hypothetical protein
MADQPLGDTAGEPAAYAIVLGRGREPEWQQASCGNVIGRTLFRSIGTSARTRTRNPSRLRQSSRSVRQVVGNRI